MKRFTVICLILLSACQNQKDKTQPFVWKKYHYKSKRSIDFLNEVYQRFDTSYRQINKLSFLGFCDFLHIDSTDTINEQKFNKISFFHQLFTSVDGENKVKGGALQIPYYWHWKNPNPRHNIFSLTSQKVLKDIPPAKEYGQYNNFAEIDRKPILFYSDLFSEKPNYSDTLTGNFYTFGWCSEREMAFVALMEELGYEGRVMIGINHSWSEFRQVFKNNAGEKLNVCLKVDNTFDKISYWTLLDKEVQVFSRIPDDKLGKWYNENAHSLTEKAGIRDISVSKATQNRIDSLIIYYFSTPKSFNN
jgi:hypothetical protein